MPTPISGYVYLIGSDRFGWFKIGKANNPQVRVERLGVLLPFAIKIFAIWKSHDVFTAESWMHEQNSEFHINGEWFSFSPERLKLVIDCCGSTLSKRIFPDDPHSNFAHFANIRKDVIKDGWKAEKNRLFRKATEAYMQSHGMEPTRENKKIAIGAILVVREKELSREQSVHDKLLHSKARMS
jgi:hypothetical protein